MILIPEILKNALLYSILKLSETLSVHIIH